MWCFVTECVSWCLCLSVVTNQRTEAGPCQRHGEGCHGNRAEVKDSGIDVQWRQSLRTTNRKKERFHSFISADHLLVIIYKISLCFQLKKTHLNISSRWCHLEEIFSSDHVPEKQNYNLHSVSRQMTSIPAVFSLNTPQISLFCLWLSVKLFPLNVTGIKQLKSEQRGKRRVVSDLPPRWW